MENSFNFFVFRERLSKHAAASSHRYCDTDPQFDLRRACAAGLFISRASVFTQRWMKVKHRQDYACFALWRQSEVYTKTAHQPSRANG